MGCAASLNFQNAVEFALAKPSADVLTYVITVESAAENAAENGRAPTPDLVARLIGTCQDSGEIRCDVKFRDDFLAGDSDLFASVKLPELGRLAGLELRRVDPGGPPWMPGRVVVWVKQKNEEYVFPCYRWIESKEANFLEGTASLPHKVHGVNVVLRNAELEAKRVLFRWKDEPGLPPSAFVTPGTLPRDESWPNDVNVADVHRDFIQKLGLEALLDKSDDRFESLDAFAPIYERLPRHPLADAWQTDEEFGRLHLEGACTLQLERVTGELPPNFALRPEQVERFFKPEQTLAAEIKARHIFIVNCKDLSGLKPKHGQYFSSPICLFYLNEDERLLPIAIQLHQEVDLGSDVIFTPADSECDWLLAKMAVLGAELVRHVLCVRLLRTCLVLETLAVAAYRSMPSCHPVYKLLRPHLRFQIAENEKIRSALLADDGPLDFLPLGREACVTLMERSFATWRFDQCSPISSMNARNINTYSNFRDLKKYPYRDEGVRVWQLLYEYVKEIVDRHYDSDFDVLTDYELQAWAAELTVMCPDHAFPATFTGLKHLYHVVSTVIWTATAQHAAAALAQYDTFGWVPAAPASFTRPVPGRGNVKKGLLDRQGLLERLPGKELAVKQATAMYLMSLYPVSADYLGRFSEKLFVDDNTRKIVDTFKRKTSDLSRLIVARGSSTWQHFAPCNVPNGAVSLRAWPAALAADSHRRADLRPSGGSSLAPGVAGESPGSRRIRTSDSSDEESTSRSRNDRPGSAGRRGDLSSSNGPGRSKIAPLLVSSDGVADATARTLGRSGSDQWPTISRANSNATSAWRGSNPAQLRMAASHSRKLASGATADPDPSSASVVGGDRTPATAHAAQSSSAAQLQTSVDVPDSEVQELFTELLELASPADGAAAGSSAYVRRGNLARQLSGGVAAGGGAATIDSRKQSTTDADEPPRAGITPATGSAGPPQTSSSAVAVRPASEVPASESEASARAEKAPVSASDPADGRSTADPASGTDNSGGVPEDPKARIVRLLSSSSRPADAASSTASERGVLPSLPAPATKPKVQAESSTLAQPTLPVRQRGRPVPTSRHGDSPAASPQTSANDLSGLQLLHPSFDRRFSPVFSSDSTSVQSSANDFFAIQALNALSPAAGGDAQSFLSPSPAQTPDARTPRVSDDRALRESGDEIIGFDAAEQQFAPVAPAPVVPYEAESPPERPHPRASRTAPL